METKQKTIRFMAVLLVLVGLIALPTVVGAGDLEPSGPPGPTMKTLDEVEPRIPISQADIPLTIDQSGSYYLIEDVSSSVTAITIDVNDVTIDLAGYSLIGSGSNNNGILMYGRSNVEIRNGTIRNFGWHGIIEFNIGGNGRNHRIINIRAIDNGLAGTNYHGIYLPGSGHLVKDCTASDNGGRGIYVGLGSTVTGSTASNNGIYGIYAASGGSTVTGNTAYNNGNTGISAGSGSTVNGNTAYNNGSHGIYVGNGSTVTGNTARYNSSYGIYAGYGSMVAGNTAYSNESNGIYAGPGSTVIGNTARYNQNYGIYLGGNSLVDQNTATNNNQSGGGYDNFSPCGSCTFGTNHNP